MVLFSLTTMRATWPSVHDSIVKSEHADALECMCVCVGGGGGAYFLGDDIEYLQCAVYKLNCSSTI